MKSVLQVVVLATGETFGRLLALGLTAVIARVYGLHQLAVLAVAQALVGYASIAGDAGLGQEATRRLIQGEERHIVVRDALRSQVASALFATGLVTVGVFFYDATYFKTFLFFTPIPLALAVSTPYLLDSVGRMGTLAVSRLVLSLGTTAVGLAWVAGGGPAWSFGLAYSVGAWLATAWIVWRSRAPLRHGLQRMGADARRARLLSGLKLGTTAFLVHVQASLPLLVAGRLSSSSDLGIMGVISRLWFVLSAPVSLSIVVMLPLFVRRGSRSVLASAMGIAATYGAAVTLATHLVGGDVVVFLYGGPASSVADDLSIFVLGLVPMGVVTVVMSWLIAHGMERLVPLSFAVSIGVFLVGVMLSSDKSAADISLVWVLALTAQLVVLLSSTLRAVRRRMHDRSGLPVTST